MDPTLMERLLTAIDGEDWAGLAALFTPDAIYEVPGHAPIHGRDALLRYYREERNIATGRHDLEGVLTSGDHAVSWGRFRATTRDGRRIDTRFADLCHGDGERIRRRRVYFFAVPDVG